MSGRRCRAVCPCVPWPSEPWPVIDWKKVSTTSDADTDDEVVTIELGTLPEGLTSGDVTNVSLVITDPQRGVSVPTVNLSASPTTVREGASTTLTDGDDEPGPPGIDVTIPLSVTAGTAESGDDTSPIGIEIRKGETSGTESLTANQDGDPDDETLTIGFGTLPGGITAGGDGERRPHHSGRRHTGTPAPPR